MDIISHIIDSRLRVDNHEDKDQEGMEIIINMRVKMRSGLPRLVTCLQLMTMSMKMILQDTILVRQVQREEARLSIMINKDSMEMINMIIMRKILLPQTLPSQQRIVMELLVRVLPVILIPVMLLLMLLVMTMMLFRVKKLQVVRLMMSMEHQELLMKNMELLDS